MLGGPIVGLLSDRFGRVEVAGSATLAVSIGVWAFWIPAQGYALSVVFALMAGGILGVFWTTISALCVEVAGIVELPSMLALAFGTIVLPVTFTEAIALKIRRSDSSRPYLLPQIWTGTMYLIASLLMLALGLKMKQKKRTA
jgi:MFS family permease